MLFRKRRSFFYMLHLSYTRDGKTCQAHHAGTVWLTSGATRFAAFELILDHVLAENDIPKDAAIITNFILEPNELGA